MTEYHTTLVDLNTSAMSAERTVHSRDASITQLHPAKQDDLIKTA